MDQQQRFLAFLTPRVGSREAAREVLQAAMLKALERGGAIQDSESAVAWFFRLLRNTLVDRARQAGAEQRALEATATEALLAEEAAVALERHVCACVEGLLAEARPEYAAVVRAVDLEGSSVQAFARQAGLTAGNARVRLHRARTALADRLLQLCGVCCAQGCAACGCEA